MAKNTLFLTLVAVLVCEFAFCSTAMYESGYERAYYDVSMYTQKSVDGRLWYKDSWWEEDKHSAVWIFVKDANGHSVDIESVYAPIQMIESRISENKKGIILVNVSGAAVDCIDLRIEFSQSSVFASVHVLEMVFVNEGGYELGSARSFEDRNTIATIPGSLGAPLNAFYTADVRGHYVGPYRVKSEQELKIGKCEGCLFTKDAQIPGVNTYSGEKEGVLSASFPKGFAAFYQMRYELTEMQYCDFLNSLKPTQYSSRIALDQAFQEASRSKYGNSIQQVNGVFVTATPLQACSFLSWSDCLAYADWAGLRLMTELEFEKAARGFDPSTFRAFSWGSGEYLLSKELVVSDVVSGKNVVGNVHLNYLGFGNYREVCVGRKNELDYRGCRILNDSLTYRGPLTTGIHAYSACVKDRFHTGSSYFGAMDLSGNLREPVVPIGDANNRRNYLNHMGDGHLDAQGDSDEPQWQFLLQKDAVYGYRGGSWSYHENHGQIADRFNVFRQGINKRTPFSGFRGVVGMGS